MESNYTPAEAYAFFEALGEAGRQHYVRLSLIFDSIFPVTYVFCWAILIAFFFKKWLPPTSIWRHLCLLPFLAGLADYLENICILTMLFRYPDQLHSTARLTSLLSIIKFDLTTISMLTLLIGLAVYGYKSLVRKR